jgi:hypothetical protein
MPARINDDWLGTQGDKFLKSRGVENLLGREPSRYKVDGKPSMRIYIKY